MLLWHVVQALVVDRCRWRRLLTRFRPTRNASCPPVVQEQSIRQRLAPCTGMQCCDRAQAVHFPDDCRSACANPRRPWTCINSLHWESTQICTRELKQVSHSPGVLASARNSLGILADQLSQVRCFSTTSLKTVINALAYC